MLAQLILIHDSATLSGNKNLIKMDKQEPTVVFKTHLLKECV